MKMHSGLFLLITAGIVLAFPSVLNRSVEGIIIVPPPTITNSRGNVIEEIKAGHQITIFYDYNNSKNQPQPFVMLFEIRDEQGVSVHLA